jgi:beta-lactamase regulating signal transducer with metallopeptidase domain
LYLSFLLTGDQVAAAGAKSIKTPQPAGAKSIKTPQPAGAKSSKATTAATEVSDQTINAQAAQANPIWTDTSISAMAVACAVALVAVAAVVALLRPRGRRCSSSTSRNEYNRNDIDEGRHYAAAKGRIVQDRQGRSTRVYSR